MVGVICVQYTVGTCTCMCIVEAFSIGSLVAETMGLTFSGFLYIFWEERYRLFLYFV